MGKLKLVPYKIPQARFQDYTCREDYINNNVEWVEPMLAKELNEEKTLNLLKYPKDYIVEEKLDGTRATIHFTKDGLRIFSRRVSKKTEWFCENTDSLPHIRDIKFDPSLIGNVIDGELRIPNKPFKDVSSTMNCKWDEAILRQRTLGKVCFYAFDIIYGAPNVSYESTSLKERKEELNSLLVKVNSEYLKILPVFSENKAYIKKEDIEKLNIDPYNYPSLHKAILMENILQKGYYILSFKAYYEYIVCSGGEGVILKPLKGLYNQGKRGNEYIKVKKLLTRDCIITGFNPPTETYEGKFPDVFQWDYWITNESDFIDLSESTTQERKDFLEIWGYDCIAPITKHFCKGWIGTIVFSVIITEEEKKKLPPKKSFNVFKIEKDGIEYECIEVGECSGFDEVIRQEVSENQERFMLTVLEVKCNEIFNDTGKLRHPRFNRFREDKNIESCVWKDHIL